MRAHRSPALALALALCGLPGLAFSQTAAVVPLLSVNLQEAEVDALTEALAEGLQAASAQVVRGGRSIRRRLPEGGVAPDCPSDSACALDLLARLEVEALVFVILTKVGAQVQIDPSIWINGQAEARTALRGAMKGILDAAWVAQRVQAWLPQRAAAAPSPVTATAPPPPVQWRRPSWPVWVAGGVALTALSVGVGLGVDAGRKEAGLVDAGCDLRPCAESDIDALAQTARGADAAFVISGLAAAAGVGLYYVLDTGPESLVVRVHSQGLAIAGQF
jgi:hypothetical protein